MRFNMEILTIILVLHANEASDEVSATADMEALVSKESVLLHEFANYIQEEENRLKELKALYQEYDIQYQDASASISTYVSNAINAYVIVKRLTSDWKRVERALTKNAAREFIRNITQHQRRMRFPSEEDLKGAAIALIRLQDTYMLDTHELADGYILGRKYARGLTANDCWELGRQSYNDNDHYHTVLWMAEALTIYEKETKNTVDRQDILEYLSISLFQQGNIKEAFELTNELLKIVPHHRRALSNRQRYGVIFQHLQRTGRIPATSENEKPFSVANLKLIKPFDSVVETDINYSKLCRGEKLLDKKTESLLECRHVTNNAPFLLIQPVKMEEISLNPYIVVYHEVLNDGEIDTIKTLAQPKFVRATGSDKQTGEQIVIKTRTSKSSWLANEAHPHIHKVHQRVGIITGLDMASAEELQVANYGIGGHYEPHYDFASKEEIGVFNNLGLGNRMATWLFYMSDVEAGGATVFPDAKVAIWPRKGSAAFWYNLNRSGEGNPSTRHAACPVLTGSKWVCTKWIHEHRHEFLRPCGLHYEVGV